MAQPQFVPESRHPTAKYYESPPRRAKSWRADRPGEVVGRGQPASDGFGRPGPDQGYALTLVHLFDDELELADGESRDDAVAGCVEIATKRAALFGRAPVVHDLRVAFGVWGFLSADPPPEQVEHRRVVFRGIANPYHYRARRAVVDSVHDEVLRLPHTVILETAADDWRSVIDVT